MEPLVTEIMTLIEAGADDPRLRWSADRTTVTVVFSRLILDGGPMPAAPGRRARFGDAWRAAMAEHGWVPTGQSGTFTRPGHRGDRGQPTIVAARPSLRPATPDGRRLARAPECGRTNPVNSEPARIRPYRPDDLDELYRICVQTADNGHDATSMYRDPRLPGHVYAAPYAIFEPSLAFVAQDAGGVGGYIVAALDSQAFEGRLERDWWPALRASHPEPPQDLAQGLSPRERLALHWIHHPLGTPDGLARGFPSHLHINLVPRLQGQGTGRQLIATVISALRDQGSHGLHLHVRPGNQRAAGFYRHLGFAELPADDGRVFTMKLTQPAE